jgi:PH domain
MCFFHFSLAVRKKKLLSLFSEQKNMRRKADKDSKELGVRERMSESFARRRAKFKSKMSTADKASSSSSSSPGGGAGLNLVRTHSHHHNQHRHNHHDEQSSFVVEHSSSPDDRFENRLANTQYVEDDDVDDDGNYDIDLGVAGEPLDILLDSHQQQQQFYGSAGSSSSSGGIVGAQQQQQQQQVGGTTVGRSSSSPRIGADDESNDEGEAMSPTPQRKARNLVEDLMGTMGQDRPPVLKAGYLYRKGSAGHWKRRFFELTEVKLRWRHDEKEELFDALRPEKLENSVLLDTITLVSEPSLGEARYLLGAEHAHKISRRFVFTIERQGEPTFVLAAPSAHERAEWVLELRELLHAIASRPMKKKRVGFARLRQRLAANDSKDGGVGQSSSLTNLSSTSPSPPSPLTGGASGNEMQQHGGDMALSIAAVPLHGTQDGGSGDKRRRRPLSGDASDSTKLHLRANPLKSLFGGGSDSKSKKKGDDAADYDGDEACADEDGEYGHNDERDADAAAVADNDNDDGDDHDDNGDDGDNNDDDGDDIDDDDDDDDDEATTSTDSDTTDADQSLNADDEPSQSAAKKKRKSIYGGVDGVCNLAKDARCNIAKKARDMGSGMTRVGDRVGAAKRSAGSLASKRMSLSRGGKGGGGGNSSRRRRSRSSILSSAAAVQMMPTDTPVELDVWMRLTNSYMFAAFFALGLFCYVIGAVGASLLWVAAPVGLIAFALSKVEQRRQRRLSDVLRHDAYRVTLRERATAPETMHWFNVKLTSIWRTMLSPLLERELGALLEARLAEKFAEPIGPIRSVSLVSLTLGQVAPRFTDVRVIRAADGNSAHDMHEFDVQYLGAARVPGVSMRLRLTLTRGLSFGVLIDSLHIEGRLRTTSSFLADAPYVDACTIAFVKQPVLKFAISPSGIDITAVPWLGKLIRAHMRDTLATYFVLPNMISVGSGGGESDDGDDDDDNDNDNDDGAEGNDDSASLRPRRTLSHVQKK